MSAIGNAVLEAVAALRPAIRSHQADIERERCLPHALVEQLRRAGAYRLLVPESLGGAQVGVSTFFRAIELVAEGDGSAGWNVATNAALTMAVFALPDEGVKEIYRDGPDVIFSGTVGVSTSPAVPVAGGYLVTGRWRVGSGCRNSDWMGGTCQVIEDDKPRLRPDGTPEQRRFFVPTKDCTIIDTWDTVGLRGTGSHDWSVTNLFVPEARTQDFDALWSRWPGTLYDVPVQALRNGLTFSAVATGIARAAIDALAELAGSKVPTNKPGLLREQGQVQESVGRAEALLGAAQAYRVAATEDVWNTVATGAVPTREQLARCRLAALIAVENSMQATDLMYRAGGTTSIEHSHVIARCWRDIHVVGQNFTVLPEFYQLAGRLFLGLDPGPRL
jgi:alkylation response protein AidB-like acyl-CoA dehydrogenase